MAILVDDVDAVEDAGAALAVDVVLDERVPLDQFLGQWKQSMAEGRVRSLQVRAYDDRA